MSETQQASKEQLLNVVFSAITAAHKAGAYELVDSANLHAIKEHFEKGVEIGVSDLEAIGVLSNALKRGNVKGAWEMSAARTLLSAVTQLEKMFQENKLENNTSTSSKK